MARISFFLTALALLAAATACGGRVVSDEASEQPPGPAPWPSELFSIRPEGAKGPLVAFDMASADGRVYYVASAGQSGTTLEAFDSGSGELARRFALKDAWTLSGVSPSGHWVALTRSGTEDARKTEIEIVDGTSGGVDHLLRLDGSFEVETISADGNALFLIEHVDETRNLVRLYDLSRESLVADPLRSKGADELMTGYAWGGLASPDGRWLLTLYLSTARDVAFVHALNLVDKVPVCIDLPSGRGDLEQLKSYTLALSPGGESLYAANPSLGVVAEIDLADFETRAAEFPARPMSGPAAHSVVVEDGSVVYFTGGGDVWAYNTVSDSVTGLYSVGTGITGLGLSGDGHRLYVTRSDRPPAVIDTATGRELSTAA